MKGAPARKSEFFFVLLNIMGSAITQPKTSDASVQIQIELNVRFEFVLLDTRKSEFSWLDVKGSVITVETVMCCCCHVLDVKGFVITVESHWNHSGNCHVYHRIIIEHVHMCIGVRLQYKNALDQSENCHDTSPVFFFCSGTTGACEND